MTEQHINSVGHSTPTRELDRPPRALRKSIEAIKDAVAIERVAAEYGEFKLLGNERLLGRCVSPFHGDRTPSMTVFTDTQRFKCFGIGCGISGDVIDLEEVAGRHAELWTAVLALSTRYNVELPRRPVRWHKWQSEKHERRKMVSDAITKSYQRRLYRVYGGFLEDIQDPEAHRQEAERFWDDLYPVAHVCAMRRVGL
jgi:DNA primase